MNKKNKIAKSRFSVGSNNSKKKPPRYGTELEIGRISVNYPRIGRIDIYIKPDKNRGAVVICEEDGGRYGVTLGVLKHFSKPGSHIGWAYVNPGQTMVFKFVLGDASNRPAGLFSIETSDGLVDFPTANRSSAAYPDGAFVAFYARLARSNRMPQPRRQAIDVFLLDGNHLPLIARLTSAGRLSFPEHNEVCELFLNAISDLEGLDRQCQRLFESALSYLASHSRVPAQYQTLARIERSRLDSAVEGNIKPQLKQQLKASKPKTARKRELTTTKVNGRIVVDDVVPVGLKIEEE